MVLPEPALDFLPKFLGETEHLVGFAFADGPGPLVHCHVALSPGCVKTRGHAIVARPHRERERVHQAVMLLPLGRSVSAGCEGSRRALEGGVVGDRVPPVG